MESVFSFVQAYRPYFGLAQALSSAANLLAWCLALILLMVAIRRNKIDRLVVGPISIMMKEEAVQATAAAARSWQSKTDRHSVDVPRIRATVWQMRVLTPIILPQALLMNRVQTKVLFRGTI